MGNSCNYFSTVKIEDDVVGTEGLKGKISFIFTEEFYAKSYLYVKS